MVECDSCLTWIHITCTDLKRRDRVPEVWHCYKCVEKRNKAKGNIQVNNCIIILPLEKSLLATEFLMS